MIPNLEEYFNDKQKENKVDLCSILFKNITSNYVLPQIIDKYYNEIIDSINNNKNNNLYELLKYFKDNYNNEEIINIIKNKIKKNPKLYLENLINKLVKESLIYYMHEGNLHTLVEIIYLIINELVENEKEKYENIEIFGQGSYSSVLKIGEKIIKIGYKRETFNIDKIPYIIQPLLRKEFVIDYNTICIEVTELVDIKSVSEEDVYKVYKKVRELGYVWADASIYNIGRLKKDNRIYFNKNINPSDEVLNFNPTKYKKILKKGEIVIIDSDYIYDENSKKIIWSNLSNNYENRYQNEKNKNIVKK